MEVRLQKVLRPNTSPITRVALLSFCMGRTQASEKRGRSQDRSRPVTRQTTIQKAAFSLERTVKQGSSSKISQDRRHESGHWGCEVCAKDCPSRYELYRHLWKHVPAFLKPFRCEEHQQAWVQRNNMERHMEEYHPSEVLYKCRECSLVAQTRGSISTHLDNSGHRKKYELCLRQLHKCDRCVSDVCHCYTLEELYILVNGDKSSSSSDPTFSREDGKPCFHKCPSVHWNIDSSNPNQITVASTNHPSEDSPLRSDLHPAGASLEESFSVSTSESHQQPRQQLVTSNGQIDTMIGGHVPDPSGSYPQIDYARLEELHPELFRSPKWYDLPPLSESLKRLASERHGGGAWFVGLNP